MWNKIRYGKLLNEVNWILPDKNAIIKFHRYERSVAISYIENNKRYLDKYVFYKEQVDLKLFETLMYTKYLSYYFNQA